MMKKKRLVFILCAIIAVIAIYGVVKSRHKPTQAPIVNVAQGDIIVKVTAVGNIMPVKSAVIKSSISGNVAHLFHDEGDYVSVGDPLLEINPQPTPDAYVKAKQQVKVDMAAEQKDLKDVTRYQYLLKQGAISENDQDYANAVKNYKTDRLQRIQDQELLSLLEKGKANIGGKQIGNIIVSSADGYIVERDVNLGDPVAPQTDYQQGSQLFVVADMRNMIFKGQVNETDAAKLHVGMKATLAIAALPDFKITGTLSKLGLQSVQASNAANAQTNANQNLSGSSAGGTSNSPFNVGFKIEINQLQLPKNIKLLAGYSATADIVVQRVKNVLIIPERVLQFEGDKTYVWISGKDNKRIKQYVKIGLSDGMNAQVLSGLKLNQSVLETGPDTKTNQDDT